MISVFLSLFVSFYLPVCFILIFLFAFFDHVFPFAIYLNVFKFFTIWVSPVYGRGSFLFKGFSPEIRFTVLIEGNVICMKFKTLL
jgi:hypothetical protein